MGGEEGSGKPGVTCLTEWNRSVVLLFLLLRVFYGLRDNLNKVIPLKKKYKIKTKIKK